MLANCGTMYLLPCGSVNGLVIMYSTKTVTSATVLTIGKKGAAYNPQASSMQNNAQSWAVVQAAFKANSVQTYGGLVTALKANNHGNFAGYCIRRGWLLPK